MPYRLFLFTLIFVAPVVADGLNDGDAHGDPPFLIEDGWKPLFNGKDLAGWHGQDPGAPNEWLTARGIVFADRRLTAVGTPGDRLLNGREGKTVNLITDAKFGDVELYLEFMLAKGSNSGVYLHGLYELQIFDSFGASEQKLTMMDCGGIHDGTGVRGSPPSRNASRAPGEWQSYHVWFQAPRFDASGKKIGNARFVRVLLNGVPVQKDFEIAGPTAAAMAIAEVAENPLMIQGDHGPVALRNIYVRPLRPIIKR